jgi:putative membrane protein
MQGASVRPLASGYRGSPALPAIAVAYALWWGALALAPQDRLAWSLENLVVAASVAALALTYRRFRFSDRSYLLIALYLALHAVGAHYTYGAVPAGEWAREVFGLARNHFDRLVHFAFGLLLVGPAREVAACAAAARGLWAGVFALGALLALSAVYEILEWVVAVTVRPDLAHLYLAAQGDPWDTQKDMALAVAGATLALAAAAALRAYAPKR